ncbi:hypothetical protein QJQ45_015472 [Haematococcus lacustris]|nr:hypothetical protein QJQ45_015472 [Haematococcus lacustris]
MATRNPSLNMRPELLKAAGIHKAAGDDQLIGPRGLSWWTGLHPTECPGYCPVEGCLKSLPLPSTHKATRQQVLDYFDNAWTLTEVLFASLQGEDTFLRQPYHQLRHPMVFYYGHPAVLYINKLRVAGVLEDGIDQFFEQLFETGVDEMSWDDLSQGRDDWPPIAAITDYRRKAYQIVKQLILTHPCLDKPDVGLDDPAWAVFMGPEHERIHLETSSVLIRELPLACVRKPEYWPEYHPSSAQPSPALPAEGVDYPANDLVPVGAETVALGKPLGYPSFGWDNEYGGKQIAVQPFCASRFKVTNGEFLRFVKAGGYSQVRYWSTEGWGWRTFRNAKWPTFWIPNGPQGLHKYQLRALFNAINMRWDWPVDVNYHEAKAFCAWRTEQDASPVRYRVITEAEHQLLRNAPDRVDFPQTWGVEGPLSPPTPPPTTPGSPPTHALGSSQATGGSSGKGKECAEDPACNPDPAMLAGGADAPTRLGANLQLAWSSQSPVTELPASVKGFHDALGNAWEWAEDHYAAFPGFAVHPYYEDFSAPCFGGKHQLILGGSFISTGQLASKFARYQFRPHFFQHATFRVVAPQVHMSQYDLSRYGPENPIVPFVELSCMDCAPPYVGDGPCCSCKRRGAFTPTLEEEKLSTAAKNKSTQVLYESDRLLAQVLATHYGSSAAVFAPLASEAGLLHSAQSFHAQLAEGAAAWVTRLGRQPESCRALDLGCSVGRGTFELARFFAQAVGIDLSTRVIEVASKLRENKRFEFDNKIEGDITQRVAAVIDDAIDTTRTVFVTGDACNLPDSYHGMFDLVLAANLMDRVPDPQRVLQQARAALAPGGILLLTSPFSWDEEYTERVNWLGGAYKDGAPLRSQDHLVQLLTSMDFELLAAEPCCPLIIPDHIRKFQLLLTHKMLFKRL